MMSQRQSLFQRALTVMVIDGEGSCMEKPAASRYCWRRVVTSVWFLRVVCPGFLADRYKACDGSRSRRAVHPYAHNNVFPLLSLLSLVLIILGISRHGNRSHAIARAKPVPDGQLLTIWKNEGVY